MGYASHGEARQAESAARLRELERIVSELGAKVSQLAQQVSIGGGGGGFGSGNMPKDMVYAKTASGGLSPATGVLPAVTLGFGTVEILDKSTVPMTATGLTVTCFSGSSAVVGAGVKLIGMLERKDGSGTYDCLAEFC